MSIKTGEMISASNPELKAKTFTMTMEGGYEATVMTYGAVIVDLIVPDKDGKPTDIMLDARALMNTWATAQTTVRSSDVPPTGSRMLHSSLMA
ncbi:MAG: hypothetical protein IKH06_06680 [Clostridiales bacterium]|nr:hypothetical protein [Clostridiales bacterium]